MINNLFEFLLKAGLISILMYAFYRIFLDGSTYHTLNRAFLVFIPVFSVLAPLSKSIEFFNTPNTNSLWINDFQEGFTNYTQEPASNLQSTGIDVFHVLKILYFSIVALLLLRFFYRIIRLFLLKKASQKHTSGEITFYVSSTVKDAFSFFRWIIIPAKDLNKAGTNEILEHEKVHAEQWHSIDLILMEIFCITFWFNPFVIPLRKGFIISGASVCPTKILAEHDNVSAPDVPMVQRIKRAITPIIFCMRPK